MKKEFIAAFQLDRMNVFEVRFYTLGSNKTPDFATTAGHFIRSKRDYDRCGQCQETICKNFKVAYDFYKKWDVKHLSDLTEVEYNEMVNDLNKLKETYNYIYRELKGNYKTSFAFSEVVELSKQKVKKVLYK